MLQREEGRSRRGGTDFPPRCFFAVGEFEEGSWDLCSKAKGLPSEPLRTHTHPSPPPAPAWRGLSRGANLRLLPGIGQIQSLSSAATRFLESDFCI